MTEIKLASPRVKVVMENDAGEWVEYIVQTDNRDAVRFDVMRARRHWPDAQEGPMLWMTVMAWSALKRSGEIGGAWGEPDKFFDACVEIVPVDEHGNVMKGKSAAEIAAVVAVDPTLPDPESGY